MITAKAEGNKLTLNVDTDIGEDSFFSFFEDGDEENKVENEVKTSKDLNKILNANKDASLIDIYINSLGGDVFEGVAIYNVLKRTRAYKRVFIDGIAASAASVIAMAGNSIYMPKSAMMMIHNAWSYVQGNANDLRKAADELDVCNSAIRTTYMERFKGTEDELKQMMDDETFLAADQCLEYGLCTKITDSMDDDDERKEEVDNSMNKYNRYVSATLKRREGIQAMLDKLEAETTRKTETVKEPLKASSIKAGFLSGETVNEVGAVNEADKQEEKKPEEPKLNALEAFFGNHKR